MNVKKKYMNKFKITLDKVRTKGVQCVYKIKKGAT